MPLQEATSIQEARLRPITLIVALLVPADGQTDEQTLATGWLALDDEKWQSNRIELVATLNETRVSAIFNTYLHTSHTVFNVPACPFPLKTLTIESRPRKSQIRSSPVLDTLCESLSGTTVSSSVDGIKVFGLAHVNGHRKGNHQGGSGDGSIGSTDQPDISMHCQFEAIDLCSSDLYATIDLSRMPIIDIVTDRLRQITCSYI